MGQSSSVNIIVNINQSINMTKVLGIISTTGVLIIALCLNTNLSLPVFNQLLSLKHQVLDSVLSRSDTGYAQRQYTKLSSFAGQPHYNFDNFDISLETSNEPANEDPASVSDVIDLRDAAVSDVVEDNIIEVNGEIEGQNEDEVEDTTDAVPV